MRSVELAGGAPSGLAGWPGTVGGATRGPPVAGSAEATWLNAGAEEVQPWGTDRAPSEAARPAVALTVAPPRPGELTTPTPGPKLLPRDDPDIWKLCANAPVAVPSEFISGAAEPSIDTPEPTIEADAAAPDATLVPAVAAVADVEDVKDVAEDTGDVDEDDAIVETSPCRTPGIAAELSGDTAWAPVPAEVPAAW